MKVPGLVENDVLVGQNGQLFLAQGGHHVLDLATGKRQISPEAKVAFRHNIIERNRRANSVGAKYMHVMAP